MKNLIFSLVAICIAGVAAIAATTAFINAPSRTKPETAAAIRRAAEQLAAESAAKPAAPAPAPAAKPGSGAAAGAAAPANAPANASDTADDEVDKDPYEGLNPEELPPDLQYNADSSVSFPTNI